MDFTNVKQKIITLVQPDLPAGWLARSEITVDDFVALYNVDISRYPTGTISNRIQLWVDKTGLQSIAGPGVQVMSMPGDSGAIDRAYQKFADAWADQFLGKAAVIHQILYVENEASGTLDSFATAAAAATAMDQSTGQFQNVNDVTAAGDADREAAESFVIRKVAAVIPAPMGCDWTAACNRLNGITQLSAVLTTVLGNSFHGDIMVSGSSIADAENTLLSRLNLVWPGLAQQYYTGICSNITGDNAMVSNKADADKKIWNSLLDQDRFPSNIYDPIFAGRIDLSGIIDARKAKPTGILNTNDASLAGQGNFPLGIKTAIDQNPPGNLPGTPVQYETDNGYEVLSGSSAAPGIIVDSLGEGAITNLPTGIVYPAPATGDNFEHESDPGKKINPSDLGKTTFDVAKYVSMGLIPSDFDPAAQTWDQAKAAYEARQAASQTAPTGTVSNPPINKHANDVIAAANAADASNSTRNVLIIGGILIIIAAFAASQHQG
jgi:hypothetical protein